jgi:hypothetical protein
MPEPSLTERVQILEQKVQDLASVPARVTAMEVQILQLREEMRDGFSAIREDMTVLRDNLRGELHRSAEVLRAEMRQGDEETRRYMRVLHEEVLSRIATLGDARRPRKPK